MKKIVLIMAITVLGTGAMAAKTPLTYFQQGPATPAERAERQTQVLTEQLSLSADQAAKLKPIILARATEQTALREKMQGGDREAFMGEIRKMNEKYNPQIKAILTAEQYAKYEANQAQMRGGGMRQGGGNR